jgi:hypothetical protein
MFNNKNPVIMKNISQKTVSILIGCLLALLYAYVKTDKTDKKEVYDIRPKEINILKESYSYASEEDKEFAAGFKHGIIEYCKKMGKETPMRLDDSFVLKRIDIAEQFITYLYQFEFDKSEVSEEEWKDFLEESKKEIMTNLLTVTSETRKEFNISLSKTLELADIRLEYIYSDINDSIIGAIKLDYLDFYGM